MQYMIGFTNEAKEQLPGHCLLSCANCTLQVPSGDLSHLTDNWPLDWPSAHVQLQGVSTTAVVLLPLPCMRVLRSPAPFPGSTSAAVSACPDPGVTTESDTALSIGRTFVRWQCCGNAACRLKLNFAYFCTGSYTAPVATQSQAPPASIMQWAQYFVRSRQHV